MRPHASILGVVLLSMAMQRSASANQRWCGDTLEPCCPDPSMGWSFSQHGQDSAAAAPIIVPKHLLALRWRGEELKLRGYLDVYFAPAP